MSNRLLIVGAGGHGRVVADAAMESKKWDNILFVDRDFPKIKKSGDWDIVGTDDDLKQLKKEHNSAVVAVGDNKIRLKLFSALKKINFPITSVVHPLAYVANCVSVGKGTVIFANSVVNYGSSIGDFSIINTSATIDHDNCIGDYVHISPGVNLGGDVSVGSGSWIGIGASVIHGCRIGKNVVVGAGAVVLDDVPDNTTVVGVPAKKIK